MFPARCLEELQWFSDKVNTAEIMLQGNGSGQQQTLGLAAIPAARVVHPVIGTGFQGVGVAPDVAVPAADALIEARRGILESLLSSAGPPVSAELESALAELAAEQRVVAAGRPPEASLGKYTGRFGVRTITLEGGELRLQRQGGPRLSLVPIEGDRFRLRLPCGARSLRPVPEMRFERGDDRSIGGLSLARRLHRGILRTRGRK